MTVAWFGLRVVILYVLLGLLLTTTGAAGSIEFALVAVAAVGLAAAWTWLPGRLRNRG